MSADTEPYGDALEVLRRLAAELAQIHRAKEYSQWRDWASRGADEELARAAPFSDFADSWVFTGDGGYVVATGRFGKWAIDRSASVDAALGAMPGATKNDSRRSGQSGLPECSRPTGR